MVWPPWQLHPVHDTTREPGVSGIWSHSSAMTGELGSQPIRLRQFNIRRQVNASREQVLSAIGFGGMSCPPTTLLESQGLS